jgi:hypothetical protein
MPLHFVYVVYGSWNKHPSFPQTGFDHFVSLMEVFLRDWNWNIKHYWLIPSFEMLNTFSGMTKVLVTIKTEKWCKTALETSVSLPISVHCYNLFIYYLLLFIFHLYHISDNLLYACRNTRTVVSRRIRNVICIYFFISMNNLLTRGNHAFPCCVWSVSMTFTVCATLYLPVVWRQIKFSRPSSLPSKQTVMHSGMHEYYRLKKCDK